MPSWIWCRQLTPGATTIASAAASRTGGKTDNSPIFIEAARVFAERLLAAGPTDEQRLDTAFERTLARKPNPEERIALLKFLTEQLKDYHDHPDAATKMLKIGQSPLPPGADEPTLAAWTAVCRVLLNLQETITRY